MSEERPDSRNAFRWGVAARVVLATRSGSAPSTPSENPKRRYLVVPNQREAEVTIRKAIEELVQLNQDHAFSYDRDTLVRMLDEAMARVGSR